MESNDAQASGPISFNQVLLDEVQALRPGAFEDFVAEPQSADKPARAENLRGLFQRLGHIENDKTLDPDARRGLSALCFSGGGIRSATFNLGVIQGLAKSGSLSRFDYLSSVSGGGYIASWLRAWMCREGVENVQQTLAGKNPPQYPLAPEPKPLDRLREYSNYLTPRLGAASPDTWSAAAIVIRNLMLNWLVILPLLGLMTAVPQFVLLLVLMRSPGHAVGMALLWLALATALYASVRTQWLRRFAKTPGTPQGRFVWGSVIPTCMAGILLSTAVLWLDLPWKNAGIGATPAQTAALWAFILGWCVGIPLIGWAVAEWRMLYSPNPNGEKTASPFYELAALIVSGLIAAGLLFAAIKTLLAFLYGHPALYVIATLPILLGIYLVARMLYVAFASLSESVKGTPRRATSDDADREWWARLSGWVLLLAVAWTLASGLCLLGGHLLQQFEQKYLTSLIAMLGGISGIVAALTQRSGSSAKPGENEHAKSSGPRDWAFALVAPVFVLCVFIMVARGTGLLGDLFTGTDDVLDLRFSLGRTLDEALPLQTVLKFLLVPASLALVALVMGRVVNVNRFSLHGMYRNRLVRAYLGASNTERQPDPFTGFATSDDIKLHQLREPGKTVAPLSLINTTLNLVRSGDRLAWQQRKAESFSMSPLYCGNFHEGYRSSQEYGGAGGITLGTAVSISGAAANPNMGSSSSPVLGFLLALFNMRLGAWLGNTNQHGRDTYKLPGPRFASYALLAELFGQTTSNCRYVSLSDGGHFENLGLYEVVLRRCRYIVVSDAGQDPSFGFGDLGNAIRKIRIDFDIPIEFDQAIDILPRSGQPGGLYCAVGRVKYSAADGIDAPDGKLVYIKPTLRARGRPVPYDVYSYAQSVPMFPHESTADQWFTESQFESYRALGEHAIEEISRGHTDLTCLADLIERMAGYVEQVQNGRVSEAGGVVSEAELPGV